MSFVVSTTLFSNVENTTTTRTSTMRLVPATVRKNGGAQRLGFILQLRYFAIFILIVVCVYFAEILSYFFVRDSAQR